MQDVKSYRQSCSDKTRRKYEILTYRVQTTFRKLTTLQVFTSLFQRKKKGKKLKRKFNYVLI